MAIHFRRKFTWDLEVVVFDDLSIAVWRSKEWAVVSDGAQAKAFVEGLRKRPANDSNY